MTLWELRDELERTRPAWETTGLDGFLADGQLPALSQDVHRHQVVADELLRRPDLDDAASIQSMFSDEAQGKARQSRSKADAANMMDISKT